jgi:hypothetical protein
MSLASKWVRQHVQAWHVAFFNVKEECSRCYHPYALDSFTNVDSVVYDVTTHYKYRPTRFLPPVFWTHLN